ncbi:MAG: winged helix-turn-helix transcriptional regulator [Sneathiella sp.]|nr:winged helix-turn-helix transcriptional regulator [Sneathiella sp.]
MTAHSKKQALDIAKDCFAVRLRKLHREVSGLYDDRFRPFGLTTAQFNLLVSIAAHGEVAPKQLVETLSLEKSTVSRNIEKMQKNGWVKTTPHKDKRRHLLALTDAGEALLEKVTPAWQQAQEDAATTYHSLKSMIKDIPLT